MRVALQALGDTVECRSTAEEQRPRAKLGIGQKPFDPKRIRQARHTGDGDFSQVRSLGNSGATCRVKDLRAFVPANALSDPYGTEIIDIRQCRPGDNLISDRVEKAVSVIGKKCLFHIGTRLVRPRQRIRANDSTRYFCCPVDTVRVASDRVDTWSPAQGKSKSQGVFGVRSANALAASGYRQLTAGQEQQGPAAVRALALAAEGKLCVARATSRASPSRASPRISTSQPSASARVRAASSDWEGAAKMTFDTRPSFSSSGFNTPLPAARTCCTEAVTSIFHCSRIALASAVVLVSPTVGPDPISAGCHRNIGDEQSQHLCRIGSGCQLPALHPAQMFPHDVHLADRCTGGQKRLVDRLFFGQ